VIFTDNFVAQVNGDSHASLKQLQSLEKDFKNLDSQIERIEGILQNHKQLGSQLRRSAVESSSQTLRYSGRHDYALRWTLNKLRAADASGKKCVTRKVSRITV